jgi:hypothetical protein
MSALDAHDLVGDLDHAVTAVTGDPVSIDLTVDTDLLVGTDPLAGIVQDPDTALDRGTVSNTTGINPDHIQDQILGQGKQAVLHTDHQTGIGQKTGSAGRLTNRAYRKN